MEQRKLALVELKAKDLDEKLLSHMDTIKTAGGINSAQDKAIALHKEIKRLESRRQQASIKYNEAITHNQKLRAQIDSLRRERLVFDGIYKKLEKELTVRRSAPPLASRILLASWRAHRRTQVSVHRRGRQLEPCVLQRHQPSQASQGTCLQRHPASPTTCPRW